MDFNNDFTILAPKSITLGIIFFPPLTTLVTIFIPASASFVELSLNPSIKLLTTSTPTSIKVGKKLANCTATSPKISPNLTTIPSNPSALNALVS